METPVSEVTNYEPDTAEPDTTEASPETPGAVGMIPCPECGRMLRPQNMLRHRQTTHAIGMPADARATPTDAEWTYIRLYEWLLEHPGLTQNEIRDEIGMTLKACSNRLGYLREAVPVLDLDGLGRYTPKLNIDTGRPYTVEEVVNMPRVGRKARTQARPGARSKVVPYKNRQEECPECGAMILAMNMTRHRRDVHHVDIPKRRAGGQPAFAVAPTPNGSHAVISPDEILDRHNVTVEDIVETIVSIRFPESVPTNSIAQVLELGSVIRRFLEQP